MVLSQKLLSLANGQPVTLIYLISIALSLSIGIFFGAKNHNVDAQNHKNLSPKNKRSKYLSRYKLLIIALSVNIPMIFQFFTGKMENILFLAIPLITIGAAWSNIETFGPHIYALLSLIKNKSATGHGFANADYEKIQELRRTFFLSRWLMKDYKPRNPQKII